VTDPSSKPRGISAFIVEKEMEGFSIGKVEDKMGIRCAPGVETLYDHVRLGDEHLLGGAPGLGFKQSMATCFASDTAVKVATDAVQLFGGYGYMEDYPIAKFYRDAKILQIYEGTNQIQRMVIARNLTKEASKLGHLAEYIPTETQDLFGVTDIEA